MFVIGQEYSRDDLMRFAGTAMRQTGILYPTGKLAHEVEFVVLTSGGRMKSKLGYADERLPDKSWYYFGQGASGDHDKSRRANQMLLEPSSIKLLFTTRQPTAAEIKRRGHEKKRYRFMGAFEIDTWHEYIPRSGTRKGDKLIQARLVPHGEIPALAESPSEEVARQKEGFDYWTDDLTKEVFFKRRARTNQSKFARNLLRAYSGRCAITGTEVAKVLNAAHVIDHHISGKNAVENGLLLRADIHILFDYGLMKINPETLLVEIDPSIFGSEYAALHGKKIASTYQGSYPSREFLKKKYSLR